MMIDEQKFTLVYFWLSVCQDENEKERDEEWIKLMTMNQAY